MKIAHAAICTPRRCGLYETTRELVAAERALGVDARLVDPKPHPTVGIKGEDRGVPIADMRWAVKADLIASHSGHDGTQLSMTSQPIIHVAHGRPYSTFLSERDGGAPAVSYAVSRRENSRYRAVVTFWPEHAPFHRMLWGEVPVHTVPAPVDLDYWCPGETTYDFAGKGGSINVVVADPWARQDVSPFWMIHAFHVFRQRHEGARIHFYGAQGTLKGYSALFKVLGDSVGVTQGWAADLRPVYRAADLAISSNKINTRSVREPMACGTPVVNGAVADPESPEAFADAMNAALRSNNARLLAVRNFNPERTARAFLRVAEGVMEVACG